MIPVEEFVSISPRVGTFGDAAKPVEIELTLKGCELLDLIVWEDAVF